MPLHKYNSVGLYEERSIQYNGLNDSAEQLNSIIRSCYTIIITIVYKISLMEYILHYVVTNIIDNLVEWFKSSAQHTISKNGKTLKPVLYIWTKYLIYRLWEIREIIESAGASEVRFERAINIKKKHVKLQFVFTLINIIYRYMYGYELTVNVDLNQDYAI